MIELTKTVRAYADQIPPAKFGLAKHYKSTVCRQGVKLSDADFTFLAGWAQLARITGMNTKGAIVAGGIV